MGVGVLLLLVALVPLASSRDLRTATKVNRRTAPDPLLVQLFNDPTVTSLSKQTSDDSDDDSASGSGNWSVSADDPKPIDNDKTTVTTPSKQTSDDSDDDSTSGSGNWSVSADEPKPADNDKTTETKQTAPSSSDTATAVELATDQSVGSGSGDEPSAQAAAPTTTQTKTEDETVETKDDSTTNEDDNVKKSSFIPAETQTVTDQVEEGGNDVRDSTAAPKAKAFDEKNMYDATIVKKDDVPKPDDVTATAKSVIVPSPNEEGGLAPLTTDMNAPMNDQPQQLDQAQQVQAPQQDMTAQMAMQQQQDMPQPAMAPQPDLSQVAMQPQQDMAQPQPQPQPQADQQSAAAPQQYTSDPSMQGQAQAFAGQYPDPSQQQAATGAYQGQIPPAIDQAMVQGPQHPNAPFAPVNPYADPSMVGQQVNPQTGMPIAGMQSVPVFQGLKAKKVTLKEDECDDMYDSCPEMAKNKYCTDYRDLMMVQCKKSCGFCKVKDESSGSADESSGTSEADSSLSGSAMWNDEDNELPIWRKSGIPSVGDKVVGESASGSATASDVWSTSASGANMIKGESDTPSDSTPVVPPTAKKEKTPESLEESGSGQASEDFGSASGANLAEDLATGTVSKGEQDKPETVAPKAKYSEIPVPRVIIQQQPAAEIYPRIDLKVIAKAVNAYKSTALRMLGEAIRDAAQDAEDKAIKRTNIPMPPANDLLEKMGFPMEEPRSEIPPLPQPGANPYAQYYQQPGYNYNNYQQNYYGVQQNSVAKSEVQKPKPKAPKKEDEPKEDEESSAEEPDKKSDVKDPFQYVRHMKPGQSMQPIESRPGAALAPRSHSNPIILFKNSQISNEAAKKNAIPKAPKMSQAYAAARFGIPQPKLNPNLPQQKSNVPLELLNQNDMPAEENTPQYEQQMPTSANQLDSTMDDAAMMRSQTTTADQQTGSTTVGQTKGVLYAPQNVRPAVPKPQESQLHVQGQKASVTQNISPNVAQKKNDLFNEISTDNKKTDSGLASFFNNQPNQPSPKSENKINILPESNSYFTNQPNAGAATAQIGGKEMENTDEKSSFSEAFTKQDSTADDEHQADSLFGSLASKLSIAPEPKDDKTMEMAASPFVSQAEISGKIPKKSSVSGKSDVDNYNDDVKDDFTDEDLVDGENAQSRGALPPLNHGKEKADNLPPMLHGIEAGALPPLNHGTENAKALPPLNHEMNSDVLPPLNHGMENAKALPPLNHEMNSDVLPPLNHGKELAANLPPLNHGYQAESLPPLNHGMETASNLPPLLEGVEQQNILPPLTNNGKNVIENYEGTSGNLGNDLVSDLEHYQDYDSQPLVMNTADSVSKSSINLDSVVRNNNTISKLKSEISDLLDSVKAGNETQNQTASREQNVHDSDLPQEDNFLPTKQDNLDQDGPRKSNILTPKSKDTPIPADSFHQDVAITDKYGNFIKFVPKKTQNKSIDKDSDEDENVDQDSQIFRNGSNMSSTDETSRFFLSPNNNNIEYQIHSKYSKILDPSFFYQNYLSSRIEPNLLPEVSQVENADEKSRFPGWFHPFDRIRNPTESVIKDYGNDKFMSQETAGTFLDENGVKKDTHWFVTPQSKDSTFNLTRKSFLRKPTLQSTRPRTQSFLPYQAKTSTILSTKVINNTKSKSNTYLPTFYTGSRLSNVNKLAEATGNSVTVPLEGRKTDNVVATANMMKPLKSSFLESALFNQVERLSPGLNKSINSNQFASFNDDVGSSTDDTKSNKPDLLATATGKLNATASFIEGALFNRVDINPLGMKAKQQDAASSKQDTPSKTVSFIKDDNQLHNQGLSAKAHQINLLSKQEDHDQGSARTGIPQDKSDLDSEFYSNGKESLKTNDAIAGFYPGQVMSNVQPWQQVQGSTSLVGAPANTVQQNSWQMPSESLTPSFQPSENVGTMFAVQDNPASNSAMIEDGTSQDKNQTKTEPQPAQYEDDNPMTAGQNDDQQTVPIQASRENNSNQQFGYLGRPVIPQQTSFQTGYSGQQTGFQTSYDTGQTMPTPQTSIQAFPSPQQMVPGQSEYNDKSSTYVVGQSSGYTESPYQSFESKIGFNGPVSNIHHNLPFKKISDSGAKLDDYEHSGKYVVATNQRFNSKILIKPQERKHGTMTTDIRGFFRGRIPKLWQTQSQTPSDSARNPDFAQWTGTASKLASTTSSQDESIKSYRPPMLPPLEHAQNNPEMNFFYSKPTNTEGSRFKITADQMKNGYQFSPNAESANMLPPLNHNELPPLRYSSEDQSNDQANTRTNPPPIYPYSIPPEGTASNHRYTDNNNDYQSDDISNSDDHDNTPPTPWFPEGGNPYPIPLPPEGDQSDQHPQPSETKEGSIGKKNLIRPKPDLQCGSEWEGALGDFGTFCYKVVYEKSSWDDAHASCKSAGGDLFSVTNAYEQRFLENFTNIESWLGYRDKSLAGTWSWSDDSKAVYTDWDSSAKDDHGKGRDCVVLDADEGKWRDAACSQKHSFLCKKNAIDCTKGWKKLTLNSVRGCYKFYDELKTWSEAQQQCLDDEGSLASILSDDEQTMVSQVYSKHDMWIGYNDKDNEGDWVWTDRMTSSYTNWNDKSPNNGGISCAIVTRTGKWHDEPCQSKYSYICKKPSPKSRKDLVNDGVLTQQVQDFISNNSLIPDIDTSVSIFGSLAVSPVYFWTAQKIYQNKIHGSNPIATHGHIKSVDGGLQLNGVDSWLDAGDFYGQCLGDPDLCIKGFSFATQLNFDDDAASYKDKRYVLDSAGDSRGVSIYIQNNTVHYKVVTSSKTWDLSTDLVTNDWQDVVLTWKKEEGLMLYVNGAFRDSQKEGTATKSVPNKQARLTIGRKSGNPPYRYTRMYISSLYAFTRFLSPEDIPYVFTYDDTVSARYTWLLPELRDGKIEGSPEIQVQGPVKAVDGGMYVDGTKAFLKVGNFKDRCLGDPTKCPHGVSLSCKLKFNRIVRSYKDRRYIMDSGGHVKGNKGIAAYIVNNNLYFTLAMSTAEDTLRWTVRTSIFTVRWQRVVLTWGLQKGLWLYIDGQFRALTKTPKTIPRDVIDESSEFIIGRKNIGDEIKPAEFSIGSVSIFKRFLDKKAVSAVFGEKKMPYPGLIREVWKELPGKEIGKLKDDPYYPNDPSLVEIIENFDAPFDVDKDFGSRVKGYFVAPETGNYTFYLSGSKSSELWLSRGESQQNMSEMIALHDPTGHNQWNKFTAQISKTVSLEAGKYYYITALEKGIESTDSLSAGVRLPSGRFMRPISKETLQWRLPGDPFAGVIRELWQGIPGYKITDLTSNTNFPNNPSSIEVLDKFDAPHNIDDNYGARIRGYFKAPETGKYRFYLAADTTGELWLSTDESESNVKKVIAINGWTDHNQWLKFPEQKSEHIRLKKGRYYYFEAYHKADKLADCASVAVEFPSGHFEGPIKRVHLSWRLPDGITGPGPSSEQEAIPKPVGLYPLTKSFGAKDASGNNDNGILSNVKLADGPDGSAESAYEFSGKDDSYVEIPKSKQLDTKNSMTVLANIYPTGNGGPIINYKTDGWGVHLWQFESNELFVRFVHRNGVFHKPIGSRVIELNTWNQVGATYDNSTGVARLWHNGKMVKSRNIGQIRLATQYPIRIGARDGDDRRFSGKVACLQIYNKAMDQQQIGNLKVCPVKTPAAEDDESGSGSGMWDAPQQFDHTGVALSHEAGKYDKDEEADDLIQGSEFVSGAKKCEPNPCENEGKCLQDAKRLDGYRCKCSSDFTGRNCQVSKPDAENPVVKRTKIPLAEKKQGSEKYQKNSTSNGVIEQMREEKKEDVLLLFQKLGCYADKVTRHDIPVKADIKSVSQEECVRACALKEQGFSYFGLQDSNQCYCGHGYGKYGRSDESLCNKRCNGNNDENCGGNSTNMVYFFGLGTNYTVKVFTGDKDEAESDAKVYITLYGNKGDSGFRKLSAQKFTKNEAVSETLLLPELGELKKVRILHDNSGKHPSWFLKQVTVTDENGKVYSFPCKEWLSETRGGGKTERLLFVDNSKQS